MASKEEKAFLLLLLASVGAVIYFGAESADESFKHAQFTPTTFIKAMQPLMQAEEANGGPPANFNIAQSFLESGHGMSELATKANNLFGIKADSSWTGDTYKGYRKYASWKDSIADHTKFLKSNANYKPLWDLNTGDSAGWANLIGVTGYAEDPLYTQKLVSVLNLVPQAIAAK